MRASPLGNTEHTNTVQLLQRAAGARTCGAAQVALTRCRLEIRAAMRALSEPVPCGVLTSAMHFESAAEAKVEYRAMLLGATGNVGGHILHLLVQSSLCKKVVVATRRNAAELASPKVQQVVVNMDNLEEELAPHAKGVDIALAAFGVGKGSATMADEEVRKIEITYPMAFASAAKAGGARVLAMMTAVGADSQSSTKYLRNIGDKEKKSEELKFDFLGLYRPAVILGNSNTPSALGLVMPLLHWAMPSRYHSIHKNDLARAMVAQSEQAFLALAQNTGPTAPAVKTLEYKEMEPFFVAGDSDGP
jgi:uncharacterized protein YbjT (DUF2867 family)